jgi:putative FmdB family regulatory protein
MPIYEYECTQCGHRFEKIQKISARRVGKCPECKGRVERMVHAPAIQFKGSGWYVTDYAGKGRAPKDEKKEGSSSSDSGKSDAKKSSGSSKSEAKKSSESGD